MRATLTLLAVSTVFLLATPATPSEDGIDLQDCRIYAGPGYPGIKARCGILLRPLNPDDSASPLIDLHVAVVPALTLQPEADPFVPIAGGPGQSTIEFYAAQAASFEKVRRTRDIVLLDQRGTGSSAPLNCEFDGDIDRGEPTPEEIRTETSKCLESLPYDPRYFTTSIAVRDLEALRKSLGYTSLNVYGVSYGSRVAQHYARRYPETTRTVILDGVVPPQLSLGPDIALEAQRALSTIFDRCAEDPQCFERFGKLDERFATLMAALDEEPVTVEIPDPKSGEPGTVSFGKVELASALRLLTYHPSTIALIPVMIDAAVEGNFAPLAAQFKSSSEAMAEALSIGMHNAIVCTEDTPFYDTESLPREALEQTFIGGFMLQSMETMCAVWPKGVIDDDFKAPLNSTVPVLLLSGEEDPITPPAYAERAAVELTNSLHLVGRDQGHGVAGRGCTPTIIGQFVDDATVTGLETDCFERVFAMPFFLDFAGPSP